MKDEFALKTIGEVSRSLNIPQYVLRFWESKFSQIKPMKRGGGRRYYRPEDVEIIDAIRKLLHDDGYTIKGAQKLLREQGVKAVVQQTYAIQNSNQDEKLKKSIGDVLTNTEEISLNSIRDGLKAISDKLKNR